MCVHLFVSLSFLNSAILTLAPTLKTFPCPLHFGDSPFLVYLPSSGDTEQLSPAQLGHPSHMRLQMWCGVHSPELGALYRVIPSVVTNTGLDSLAAVTFSSQEITPQSHCRGFPLEGQL